MPVPVPEALIRFIREGRAFIIAGHEEPDGDCVGSQLAMSSLLKRLGKKVFTCSAGPFKRTEIKAYEKYFVPCPVPGRDIPPSPKGEGSPLDTPPSPKGEGSPLDTPPSPKGEGSPQDMRVIIMDCSTLDRVGKLPLEGMPLASVDHHMSDAPQGEVVFLDPAAPSVTFMTLKIFEALDLVPTTEEAELLLFGLCTDTGFFRHLDAGSAETFESAAKLAAAGASPKKVFAVINGGKSLNSRLLMGTTLAKTRSYYGGRLLVSSETLEESKRFGMESRDSDMLYQLLQSIEGVEATVIIRQENTEECTMGLRSRDRINVAEIAQQFGGGGHKNASGAKAASTIPALEEKVVAAFGPCFPG